MRKKIYREGGWYGQVENRIERVEKGPKYKIYMKILKNKIIYY